MNVTQCYVRWLKNECVVHSVCVFWLQGRDILDQLKALPQRNVSVRAVSSVPSVARNSTDLDTLRANGWLSWSVHSRTALRSVRDEVLPFSLLLVIGVQVRRINFGKLTRGILHSKFWVVDRRHVYIGSANMDWRALTQVKKTNQSIGCCVSSCISCIIIFFNWRWRNLEWWFTTAPAWPQISRRSTNPIGLWVTAMLQSQFPGHRLMIHPSIKTSLFVWTLAMCPVKFTSR